jgi:hypothetical protein
MRVVTSEMVERVARAIAADWGLNWEAPSLDRDAVMSAARAAIEAMRDPTNRMVGASWNAVIVDGDAPKGALSRKNICRARWQAMIDAALEGK